MNNIKGMIALLLVFTLFSVTVMPLYAMETPIKVYEDRQGQMLANGLYYEEVKRLTTEGWLDYYMLKMDVAEASLDLDVLVSKDPYGERKELSKLAEEGENIVAAINGDFYLAYLKNTDSLGLTYDDGELIAGYDADHQIEEGQYVFYEKAPGEVLIDMLDINYYLVSEKGLNMELSAYNKISSVHMPTYIDQTVLKTTQYLDDQYEGVYKIIIEDDIIVDIVDDTSTVDVPENGYIITMNYGFYTEAIELFEEGQKVFIVPDAEIDLEKLEFAISGGGQIVKGGQVIEEPGLEVKENERHPRTAIGISKDGNQVIMMVVDGRGKSIGATDKELANLMIEEGAYDAMLLDGGGSSELTYIPSGEEGFTVANVPSDGKERQIANGIGISNNAPKVNTIGGINFNLEDNIYYLDEIVEVNPTAYDSNYHPVDVDINKAQFSVSGIDGYWQENNKFIPVSSGQGVMTITYENYSESQVLYFLDHDVDQKTEEEILADEGYKFAFFGTTAGKNTVLDEIIEDEVTQQINEKADMAFFVGDTEVNTAELNVPHFSWENKYSVLDFEDIRFIQLGTGQGGIAKTDPYQWVYLEEALQNTTSDYVLITLDRNPLNGFVDPREKDMLTEMLSNFSAETGKQVYVMSGSGYETTYEEIDGVKYFNMNGLWYKAQGESLDLQESFYMVLFNVGEEEITYSIEPIYSNEE
ncbi:phosphodiester glycosidase family protein [Vallitalea okinawensis]|uniref:phosphodiester glycosidase family protein n=1 Tax=Vallitalea okinawensis TaxID=2078660 RepID=UPI0013005EB8|nr:phosphodiester glycosidase family protein [Vallitalea okinawensis]